jgi:hypothetical protein
MQNWDRRRQDVKFKQKVNDVKSTLPKISYANNPGPSLISKKAPNSQNLNNLENLYLNATNKMKQSSSPSSLNAQSTGSTNTPKSQGGPSTLAKGKSKDMKKQNYLKHLLNEFGLSQYLRKLYELGFDDNNIYKIGLMNRKSFQDLLNNLKMCPSQSIKMEKLYDYLKQLNLANTMYNKRLLGGRKNIPKKPATSDSNKRRINIASTYNNIIMNNYNNNAYSNNNLIYGNHYINNNSNNCNIINNNQSERPKTSTNMKIKPIQKMPKDKSKTIDNNINSHGIPNPNYNYLLNNKNKSEINNKNAGNNILLNSFKKGDLGYGFYINNNNYEDLKIQKNESNNIYNNENIIHKDFSSQNTFNKFENINAFPMTPNNNNNYYEGELIEEKMTEDIDNMLKYYMNQLNEKLDNSYGSIEDSSLSYNVSLPFAESISNNNKSNNNINQNSKLINNNNKDEINNKQNNKKHQASGKLKLPSIKDKQN